jgi:hypothetical protein
MAKRVGKLLVVEDDDDDLDDQKAGPLVVESESSEEECIVFPSKKPPAEKFEPKSEIRTVESKPGPKSNPKKRPAPSAPTGSPSKKTKTTTLVTEEPVAPHQNFNEDLTKILAGTYCHNFFPSFRSAAGHSHLRPSGRPKFHYVVGF